MRRRQPGFLSGPVCRYTHQARACAWTWAASHSRFSSWGCSTRQCSGSSVRHALRPRTACRPTRRPRTAASSHSCLPRESTCWYGGHTSQCSSLLNSNKESDVTTSPTVCDTHRGRLSSSVGGVSVCSCVRTHTCLCTCVSVSQRLMCGVFLCHSQPCSAGGGSLNLGPTVLVRLG